MIILSSNPHNKTIFSEQSLLYMSVKIEPYKNTNTAQWFSCQRFGNSSLYCSQEPRCVKCGGHHLAEDCSQSKEENHKYTNCDGSHIANFKQCPVFLAVKSKRHPDKVTSFHRSEHDQSKLSSLIVHSFSKIVSGKTNPLSNTDSIIGQITDHLLGKSQRHGHPYFYSKYPTTFSNSQ